MPSSSRAHTPTHTSNKPRSSTGSKSITSSKILATAKKHFGFESLRPGQEEAIRSILGRRDTLVVAPTGSGKSAVYQIGGHLMNGTVLVVSPLIALQKDQVESINQDADRCQAIVINSTLSASETREAFEKIQREECKFIFLAPEQLAKEETVEAVIGAHVGMFVIDEAHCVSEWGHDFRPDYLRLGRVAERLQHPVILAMTATASARVREEIAERLEMKDPKVLVGGFDRPNIFLRVDRFNDADKKREGLLHRVRWSQKPGIVYVGTRKEAESIMQGLEEEGTNAVFYHGGMKAAERDAIQDRFMSGDAEVIVATNAFGMGIDKANVRFVFHFDAPDSLDAYYQEIGRAGRDGERAEAVLFFREQDIGSQAFHVSKGKVDAADMEAIADALSNSRKPITTDELAEESGLTARKVTRVLQQMEDAGVVRSSRNGGVRLAKDADIGGAALQADEQQELRKESNRERLEQMREYGETGQCRRSILLSYFGEEFQGPCNNCDNCEAASDRPVVEPSVGTRREVA